MNDQLLFLTTTSGAIAMATWWVSSLLFGRNAQDDAKLRGRLAPTDAPAPVIETHKLDWHVLLRRVGEIASAPFMPKDATKQIALRRKFASAGIYAPAATRALAGWKMILLALGLLLGYAAGRALEAVPLALSIGGLLGYLAPTLWLKSRIRMNQDALDHGLPDALDMLVVCVEAGLTVDAALQRVGHEIALAHPRLARELEITHMETRVGVARADALRNLGLRTANAPLQALSTMLIQADRFGTSVAEALRIHADAMRTARQHSAEERAAKASVKLTFPVVLFIFPAVLIVMAGPAIIGLMKSALFAE
jgi:tight adherence protein C